MSCGAHIRITRTGADSASFETDGFCRKVSGRYHVKYDEDLSGSGERTRSHAVITDRRIEVEKKGEAAAKLVFEKGLRHVFLYETRYGSLPMEIRTTGLSVRHADDVLTAEICYVTLQNGEELENCRLVMEIRPESGCL